MNRAERARAEKVEQRAEALVELLFDAARRGEWRAVALMLDRCFGKPKEQIAIERDEPAALKILREASDEDLIRLIHEGSAAEPAHEPGFDPRPASVDPRPASGTPEDFEWKKRRLRALEADASAAGG